jgi:hypothetical protein
MYYSNFDIYKIFRKCQGSARNSGYRLPKDWDSHYANKMTKENKLSLDTITAWFNTKWARVDPETYFTIGFELFNLRFSYPKFLNKKVLLHYIQKDKMVKREMSLVEEDIKSSVNFIKQYINGPNVYPSVGSKLIQYCTMKEGMLGLPVKHYNQNKISKAFMVFLMWYGYYTPTGDELNLMPYVRAHYRDVANNFNKETLRLCDDIL